MIIPINTKYRIISDENNYIVQKSNGKAWRSLSFHKTLELATTSLFRLGVRSIQSNVPAIIKSEIETLRQEIAQAVHRLDNANIIL